MALIDTNAIVLKSVDSGETSRRLTFFSGEVGRFSLVARGVKSKSGRAHAGLEPYVIARVSANLKPDADLGTLSRSEVVERFAHFRKDLTRLAAAGVFCETLDRGTQPRLANPRLYEYAAGFLRALDSEADGKIVFLLSHALLRAAQAMGFAPELHACVSCGVATNGRWFDFAAGGLLCSRCCPQSRATGMPMEAEVAALMRVCATRPWAQVRVAADDGPETAALFTALVRWLSHHLECELKSVRFLRSALKL